MKKLVSITLVVTMLLSMVLVIVPLASAADAVTVPDGYTAVSSLADFKAMKSGGKYYLTTDLTIDKAAEGMQNGTFNGGGHTITLGSGATSVFGWFGNGTMNVSNLVIEGEVTWDNSQATFPPHVGPLAVHGGNGWQVDNVVSKVDININFGADYAQGQDHHFGGILSKAEGNCSISNSTYEGTVTITGDKLRKSFGGIVGELKYGANNKVTNCVNNGTINVTSTTKNGGIGIGGIVGKIGIGNELMVLDGCVNNADITSTAPIAHVGGIVGYVESTPVDFINCVNNGDLKATSAASENTGLGGIVGYTSAAGTTGKKVTVKGCLNTGAMGLSEKEVGGTHVGGIAGRVNAMNLFDAINCVNMGEVVLPGQISWGGAGGIIGCFTTTGDWDWSKVNAATWNIKNCHNLAKVEGVNAGGILGAGYQWNADIALTIENCSNSAEIKATYTPKSSEDATKEGRWAGGIVAAVGLEHTCTVFGSLTIKNCYNTGDVTAVWEASGIVANVSLAQGTTLIENCANTGTIASSDQAWKTVGIVFKAGNALTVKNCVNAGTLGSGGGGIAPIQNGQTIANITVEGNTYSLPTTASNYGTVVTADVATASAAAIVKTVDEYTDANAPSRFIFSNAQWNAKPADGVDIVICKDFALTQSGPNLANATVYGYDHTITVTNAHFIAMGTKVNVKDIKFAGTMASNGSHASPLSLHGFAGPATIENIVSDVDITLSGTVGAVGGIISKVQGDFVANNCSFTGSITSTGDVTNGNYYSVGGIVGTVSNTATFTNCSNSGDITITQASANHDGIGGIIGIINTGLSADNLVSLNNVSNTGNFAITAKANNMNVHIGGILGRVYKSADVSIENAINSGNISFTGATPGWESVGGIVGAIMTNCTFDASSQPTNVVASNYSIKNVINQGQISTTGNFAGGILGGTKQIYTTETADVAILIDNAVNLGKVSATGGSAIAGGIAGNVGDAGTGLWNVTIKNSANAGEVLSATWNAGGILGGYYETGTDKAATIQNSVNAGYVRVSTTPERAGDPWKSAGGILGVTLNPINIKNCVNTGVVATGNTTDFYGAFPIANTVEVRSGASLDDLVAEGNLYLASDALMEESVYTDSTKASAIEVTEALIKLDLAGYSCNDLEAAIAGKASYTEADYLASTWKTYSDAVAAGQTALTTYNETAVTERKQNTVLVPTLAILKAEAGLVTKAGATAALSAKIEEAELLDEEDYMPSTWAGLAAPLANAKEVEASPTEATVESAIKALADAIDALVTKEEFYADLNAAITLAGTKTETDYTATSWTAMQAALTAANAALTSEDAEVVSGAAADLNEAIEALVNKPNLTALNAAITAAEAKTEADYTAASWSAMQTALTAAKAALTSESQDAVNTATANLNAAVTALKTKPNYAALQAKIDEAKELNASDYTVASWASFEMALEAAEEALTADTQNAVDSAKNGLEVAINGLRKKPTTQVETVDYTALNEAIAKAEALDETEYTEESWAVLLEKLSFAMIQTSGKYQATVDNATNGLNDAIAALEKLPADETPDEDPGETPNEDPGATEAPIATDAPTATDEVEEEGGCGSAITATAVVLTTVLALGVGFAFKKKED